MEQETIDLCRAVPIHKLIGDNRLTRKVKIQCPFHAEKTGSCNLFPTGGFHCYGCGAGGDTISFVMNLGATFPEAIEELRKYT